MASWNLWHGCHKISAGCQNCYVERIDSRHGKDYTAVHKTNQFHLPLQRTRNGAFKIPCGTMVYTCFTSDFFVIDADEWRIEAWEMMKYRSDLEFFLITKRIDRFAECKPEGFPEGFEHITIACTVENQQMADYRLPIYVKSAIAHKVIVCEPLLGPIDLTPYLCHGIETVIVGGESGMEARICDYQWILDIRKQCMAHHVAFHFKQTGAYFVKEGKLYHVLKKYQHTQAKKANINYVPITKDQK